MKGRPDIIKELNLDDGLQAARGHADCAAYDVCFGQRRIKHARAAKLALQIRRHFEDAAFAFHFIQRSLARAVGHVLAENHYARIALHFSVQATIN